MVEEARLGIVPDEALARRRPRDPSDRARAVHVVVVADQLQPVFEPCREALIDHRSVHDIARRVADGRLGDRLREPIDEVVVDVPMHDRGPERRAPLAGGSGANGCQSACRSRPACAGRQSHSRKTHARFSQKGRPWWRSRR